MSTGTTNGSTTTTPAAETATETSKGETLSKADIKAIFDEGFQSYRQTINGELAAHRKALQGAKGEEKIATPAPPATLDDVRISREVGRLEEQLGEEVLAALGEDYADAPPAEQARLLRIAAKLKPRTPAAETAGQSSRGETPAMTTPNARGQAPAQRSAIPRPRTQTEFAHLKRQNPQAANDLLKDPNFSFSGMPFK